MADKVNVLEKHLKIVPQTNLKMESLQVNIEELDKWRSIEKMFQVAFEWSKLMISVCILWLLVSVKN